MGCIMYWTMLFVIGSNYAVATDVLDSFYLPWRTVLEGQPYTKETLCELPEYPQKGGYVVIGEPDARPGGVFEEVSLVQYTTAADGRSIDTNLLRCSHGKWSETIVQYTTEKLYFNTSWCSLLCSSSDVNSRVPAPTAGNLTGTYNAIKRNMNVKKLCILPPYPDRGTYQVIDNPSARPGDAFERVKLHQYTFDELKGLYEFKAIACTSGTWYTKQLHEDSDEVVFLKSRCPVFCTEPLRKPFTINLRNSEDANKKTSCKLPPYPRDGHYTAVKRPEAAPGDDLGAVRLSYSCYSNRMLVGSEDAYCIEGVWSNEAPKCIRCGLIKASALEQMSAEEKVRSELPWHVAVYDKSHSNEHICSGSVVAANLILTAAHCFWSDAESPLPASRFFVAAGKVYGDWDSPLDNHTQTSEVAEIILHPQFRGTQANYTNDIALLFLDPPLNYTDHVSTVCLNFDAELDEKQSRDVKIAKIGSWSSPSEERGASELKVDWTRYVDTGKCISESTLNFRPYVTSDKICAENVEGPTLCKVNGGGGLSYHVWTGDGARVNYLRGVASTAPTDEEECNVHPIGVYTHVLHHEDFLKKHLKPAMWS